MSQLQVHFLRVAVDYAFNHSLHSLITVANGFPAYFITVPHVYLSVSTWWADYQLCIDYIDNPFTPNVVSLDIFVSPFFS